jgi:hypothetical protein
MTRITVSMVELQIAQKMVEKGLPITDHHFDALTCAMQHVDPANWYTANEPPDKTARKVILSGKPWQERGAAIKHIIRKDLYLATGGYMFMRGDSRGVGDDSIYRVSIFPDGVDVVCLGLESVDSCLEGHYDRIDDLPNWVKERLAVLNMIPVVPPTQEVEGVGRRISGHVYWVFAPDTGIDASSSA